MPLSVVFEKHCPKITFVICFICFVVFNPNIGEYIATLSSHCVTFFSTIAGFLFTALSIMLAFQESNSVKIMKSSGAYVGVMRYLLYAIKWSLLSLSVTFIFYVLNNSSSYIDYFYYSIISLYVATLVAVIRIIVLFSKVLEIINTK